MDVEVEVVVCLCSGRSCRLNSSPNATVLSLKLAAQEELLQGFLCLTSTDGQVLELDRTLHDVGLGFGGMVTAIVQQVHLAATSSAFAAFWSGEGGRVVVWGDPCNGGDLS
ncbi:Ubiquitin-like domain-containing protein, partial [Durusdinium trenchii]